jgi:hypothetical protein
MIHLFISYVDVHYVCADAEELMECRIHHLLSYI